jgi:UDP-glucuronate 4-epimerase
MVEMQDGDVYQTFADTNAITHDLNYRSKTSVKEGIEKLYSWYKSYYQKKS